MTFDEALELVTRSGGEVHRRQLRARARRWRDHCRKHELDPLHPSADAWSAYVAGYRWDRTRANKERSAVRMVLHAAGVLDDEHGLGTGNQRWRLDALDGTPTGDLVAAFVAGRYPHRAQVARSALAKLITWADFVAVPVSQITAADLSDFDLWLRGVGGQREILVVARDWVEFLRERETQPGGKALGGLRRASDGQARTSPRGG